MRELNERQKEIVELAVVGLSNKDIAEELGTTEQVVKNYLREIYIKLGVETRIHLVLQYYAKPIAEYRASLNRS